MRVREGRACLLQLLAAAVLSPLPAKCLTTNASSSLNFFRPAARGRRKNACFLCSRLT